MRHELLPNGRYVEARDTRKRAYLERYKVTGNHIEYWNDTGFTADGEFRNNVLHHSGMLLEMAETTDQSRSRLRFYFRGEALEGSQHLRHDRCQRRGFI